MTNFAYTTGNPNNLTAGASASMNDIQGPFTDLRTFLNGANLTDPNYQNAGMGLAKLTPLILYGVVNGANGAILQAGSGGWSSVRNSAGFYTITFSPAFSATPFIQLSVVSNVAATVTIDTPAAGSTNAVVKEATAGGSLDGNFHFLVFGAR